MCQSLIFGNFTERKTMKYESFKRAGEIQRSIDSLQSFLGNVIFTSYPILEDSKKKIVEIITDDIKAQIKVLRDEFDAL